jgi:hydroxypyruvate isomerase
MHQTVREFLLRHTGLTETYKFKINDCDAHTLISNACLQILRLWVAITKSGNGSADKNITAWAPEDFESFAKSLEESPLLNYALPHLKQHLDHCPQAAEVPHLVSKLIEEIPDGPASYLLESWATIRLNTTLPNSKQNVDVYDFKRRLLHAAARMKFSCAAEVILNAGADVEAVLDRKTPLLVSAERGDNRTIQLLSDWNVNKEARDNAHRTALHHAASNGHDSTVRLFVETLGVDKEVRDGNRWTALHHAASNGHDSTVRLLVETLGVDKEARDNAQRTTLHHAASNGLDSTVRLLVETLGVDKEARGNALWTALHWASSRGHDSTVRLLVEILGVDKEDA